ncbi:unnamed protein product [Spirodela intermedia]|nr:unnamed protein product [Spirodela intermedia]CAA6659419.1 unnamed protein product [Spirodela intermedia]
MSKGKTKKKEEVAAPRVPLSSASTGAAGEKKPRRKTADGLAIYSAEELGVANPDAGGTPMCPFDCSCCF